MPNTYITNVPTIGGDENTWGTETNANWDLVDDLLDGTTAIKPNLDAGLWKVGGVAVTSTAAELNILDGVTSTAAELNILDGVTSSAAELNILDGATLTVTELNYVDGVTSAIQTQLDAKQAGDADLTAIAGLASSGMIARTGAGTAAARTITAGTGIAVTNGDGVSGNPTISATAALSLQTLQTTGVMPSNLDWTGVPSGCSEIYVFFLELSAAGTAQNLIQLMVSGTPVTSGYYNTAGLTAGFSLPSLTAGQSGTGIVKLMRASGNTWVMESGASGTSGWKTFSGVVDGVRLTTSTGTTFDAGEAGAAWRV